MVPEVDLTRYRGAEGVVLNKVKLLAAAKREVFSNSKYSKLDPVLIKSDGDQVTQQVLIMLNDGRYAVVNSSGFGAIEDNGFIDLKFLYHHKTGEKVYVDIDIRVGDLLAARTDSVADLADVIHTYEYFDPRSIVADTLHGSWYNVYGRCPRYLSR